MNTIFLIFRFSNLEKGFLETHPKNSRDRSLIRQSPTGTPVMSPQQPQSLPPSTGGNTSVAPRQRPRGSKPAAAKSILPLPPASSSANNTGEGTAATTKQIVQPPNAAAAAAPVAQEKNPFKANFVPAPSEPSPADRSLVKF